MIKEIHTRFGTRQIKMVEWESGEVPEKLYKYRDWKNDFHRKILLHQEIFIPSPRTFNDPHDCRIPISIHLLKEDEELAKEYFNHAVSRQYPDYTKKQHEQEVDKKLNEGLFRNEDFIKSENKKSIERLLDTLGVYSTTAINDNILMWAHYSNNHQGFCVGFDSVKLCKYLQGGAQEVLYKDEYPTILPTEDPKTCINKQINTKASYWDYEIEYRLTNFDYANKVIKIPKEIINEVVIGCNMSESDEKDILKLISIELPHVKTYKTKPKDMSFELKLEEIET